MKKVVLCLSVGLALLTLNADSVLTNRAEDVFADLMANTTNYWGRDVVAFREAARSGMTMLRLAENRSGEPYRMSWLTTLLGLKAPTNTCEVYRTWLEERGKWMYGLIGGFQTASCTNLWFAVADELRCLRYGIPSEESIMNRYRNELLSAAPGEVLVSSGMPEGFYNEMDMRTARMDAASTMVSLVVDCYGCRGLPLLSEDVRLVVFSNLVQRAGLTEGEAARLRRNAKLPEQTGNLRRDCSH